MAAENYHLKWDSHLTYLNSSVATLYKNEKYADVVLYSSYSSGNNGGNSDIPTVGISAHKFILSSCSQFFATMFETAPISSPNGVLYIVLPPDLSYRAIQILVQYMYSGEATVSNDILNEVLRGGEILKIRGLCRTNSTVSASTHHLHGHSHSQHHAHHRNESSSFAHYGVNGTRATIPQSTVHAQLPNDMASYHGNNKCLPSGSSTSSRYAMEHSSGASQMPHQHQFRGLGASVMPKDSPVIVKSPKLTHSGLLSIATTSNTNSSGVKHSLHLSGISVNKEVAIDPEDKCCYPSQQESMHVPPSLPQPMSICTEVGCRSCPMSAAVDASENESIRTRHQRGNHNDEREYAEPSPPADHEDVGMVFERRLRRQSTGERVRDYFAPEHFEHASQINNKSSFIESGISVATAVGARLTSPPLPQNFLAIKQEPTDWSASLTLPPAPTNMNEHSDNDNLMQHFNHHSHQRPVTPSMLSPKQPLDFKLPIGSAAIKIEVNSNSSCGGAEEVLEDKHYGNFKSLLNCELCQKSFEDTKTLMHHIESHTADGLDSDGGGIAANISGTSGTLLSSNGSGGCTGGVVDVTLPKTYVPKKRRRISQQENNMDHVTLFCDLCSTSFETPAEWVRHMSNQHTEIELAMLNSKKDGEQKNIARKASVSATVVSSSMVNVGSGCSSTVAQNQIQQQQSNTNNTLKRYNTTNSSSRSQTLMLHKRSIDSGIDSSVASNPVANINTSVSPSPGNSGASGEQLSISPHM